jgi:ribose 5-phosphate isomerase B
MKIAIGADHRGFAHKAFLKNNVALPGVTIAWVDVGAVTDERSDYPIFAALVAKLVADAEVDRGILLCGTGIGMQLQLIDLMVCMPRLHGIKRLHS